MRPGGTFNTTVFQNDINEIQSGQITGPTLLRLPLTFGASNTSATLGSRPDLNTPSHTNPILGQVIPTRIQLPQPTNCIQLIWHALDSEGNYVCSYPINSFNNQYNNGTAGIWSWPLSSTNGSGPYGNWALGWIRLNGMGAWLPMSLLPSTGLIDQATNSYLAVYPYGGFTSISGPMSFIDWIGYWDGQMQGPANGGDVTVGPMGANKYLLALATCNMSLSSNGQTAGAASNYAIPNGSGPEAPGANYDTERQDAFVRVGGRNGR